MKNKDGAKSWFVASLHSENEEDEEIVETLIYLGMDIDHLDEKGETSNREELFKWAQRKRHHSALILAGKSLIKEPSELTNVYLEALKNGDGFTASALIEMGLDAYGWMTKAPGELKRDPVLSQYKPEDFSNAGIVNRQITLFSDLDPEELEKMQKEYLSRPEIKALSCNQLLTYFDSRFPGGVPLKPYLDSKSQTEEKKQQDPKYLDPEQLVDPSKRKLDAEGKDLGAEKFHPEEKKNIELARAGVNNLVSLCMNPSKNQQWVEYTIKRVLEHLQKLKNADDEINKMIVVLSGVGQHCSTGQLEAVTTIKTMLLRTKQTSNDLREYIKSILKKEREKVFKEAIAFKDNKETSATEQVARLHLSKELGIKGPPPEIPHASYFYHGETYAEHFHEVGKYSTLSLEDFKKLVLSRFYYGKIGNPDAQNENKEVQEEMRRSHEGYTTGRKMKAILKGMVANRTYNSDVLDMIWPYVKVTDEVLKKWAKDNQGKLIPQILGLDPSEVTPEDLELYEQNMDMQQIRKFYLEDKYTLIHTHDGIPIRLPTAEALKIILRAMGETL